MRTFNPEAVGSSPTRIITFLAGYHIACSSPAVAILLIGLHVKEKLTYQVQDVKGSKPDCLIVYFVYIVSFSFILIGERQRTAPGTLDTDQR